MRKLVLMLIGLLLATGCVAGGSAQGYAGPPVVHAHSEAFAGATVVVSTREVRFQDYSEMRRRRQAERLARQSFYAEQYRRVHRRHKPARPHARRSEAWYEDPRFSCRGNGRHGHCSTHRIVPHGRQQPAHPRRPSHFRPKPRHDQPCQPDSRTHRRPSGCRL